MFSPCTASSIVAARLHRSPNVAAAAQKRQRYQSAGKRGAVALAPEPQSSVRRLLEVYKPSLRKGWTSGARPLKETPSWPHEPEQTFTEVQLDYPLTSQSLSLAAEFTALSQTNQAAAVAGGVYEAKCPEAERRPKVRRKPSALIQPSPTNRVSEAARDKVEKPPANTATAGGCGGGGGGGGKAVCIKPRGGPLPGALDEEDGCSSLTTFQVLEDRKREIPVEQDMPSRSLLDLALQKVVQQWPCMEVAGTGMTLTKQEQWTPPRKVEVTAPSTSTLVSVNSHVKPKARGGIRSAATNRSYLTGNLLDEANAEVRECPATRSLSPTSAQLLQRQRLPAASPSPSSASAFDLHSPDARSAASRRSSLPSSRTRPQTPASVTSGSGLQPTGEEVDAGNDLYRPFILPYELQQREGRPRSREVAKVPLKCRSDPDFWEKLNKPKGLERAALLLQSLYSLRRLDKGDKKRSEDSTEAWNLNSDREELLDMLARTQPDVLGKPSMARRGFRKERMPRVFQEVEVSPVAQAFSEASSKQGTDTSKMDDILADCKDTPEQLEAKILELQSAHKPLVEDYGGATHPTYLMSNRVLMVAERKRELILTMLRQIDQFKEITQDKEKVLDMVLDDETAVDASGTNLKELLFDFGAFIGRIVHKDPEGRPHQAEIRNASFKAFVTSFGLPSNHDVVLQARSLWDDEAKAWGKVLVAKARSLLEQEQQSGSIEPDSQTAHTVLRLRTVLKTLPSDNRKGDMDELWSVAVTARALAVQRHSQAQWAEDVVKAQEGDSGAFAHAAAERIEENIKAALGFGVERTNQNVLDAKQMVATLRGTAVLRYARQQLNNKSDATGAAEEAAKRIDKMVKMVMKKGCKYEQPEIQEARKLAKMAVEEEQMKKRQAHSRRRASRAEGKELEAIAGVDEEVDGEESPEMDVTPRAEEL